MEAIREELGLLAFCLAMGTEEYLYETLAPTTPKTRYTGDAGT